MVYISSVDTGQKPSSKKYLIIAAVLLAFVAASLFFAGPFDPRGHFTGPVGSDITLYKGWNLISVPYKDSVISHDCRIKAIYHLNLSNKYEKINKLENIKPGIGY